MARRDALLRLHKSLTARRGELRRRLGGDLEDLRNFHAPDQTGDAADQESATLDEAEHAQHRPLGRSERDFEALGHQPFSSICTLELFGGTSGQTFSRGSMRT